MKPVIATLMEQLEGQGVGSQENSSKSKYKDYIDVQNKAKGMQKGGKVSSASKRADGCCIRGKTRA